MSHSMNFHSQGDGKDERTIQSLENMLRPRMIEYGGR